MVGNERSPYPLDMRLYDSLTRDVHEVKPVDGRTVKIYSCGPTVYRYIHVGNFRSFMLGDLIRRALRFEGQDAKLVMNITDVGHMTDEMTDTGRDKMELAESDEGLTAKEIAEKHTQAFLEDGDKGGIGRADVYPHATDHIPEMKHLGERFDIHTGGNDNKFPHHEDEIAQSEGYTGHPVVSIWVHGGFLRLSGQKIAKSAKNVILVGDLEERGIDPLAFRLLCFGTRYRSEMDFSWEALEGANANLRTLRQRMVDWARTDSSRDLSDGAKDLDRRFRDAVADDLHMPQAMVVVSEVERSKLPDGEKHALLALWDQVLGLDLERMAREGFEIPPEVQQLVEQ